MPLVLPPLPETARRLCRGLDAPLRLEVHLQLVHECAVRILEWLHEHFPRTTVDAPAVLFGAATHDLGKARLPIMLVSARSHPIEQLFPKHGDDHDPELVPAIEFHNQGRSEVASWLFPERPAEFDEKRHESFLRGRRFSLPDSTG